MEKKSTYNGFTSAREEANKKYLSKMVRYPLTMTPAQRKELDKRAKKEGKSLNSFILDSLFNKSADNRN